ncbi:MAG: methenyl tetrahydrofolate cyclohydrolase, partial [Firmicutes bacterium]|nr:methenyl tetrahydrofolate cyclohydrolase [Bacillota bacterium]
GLMVCNLTEGKETFKDIQEPIAKLKQEGIRLKAELLRGIDGDGHSYLGIVNAYKLPKSNETETLVRKNAVQEASKEAARFSLSVGQNCLQVMKFSIDVVQYGNPNAASESLACGLLQRKSILPLFTTIFLSKISLKLASLQKIRRKY